MSEIEDVQTHAWRASVERALADGEHFGGAWATSRGKNPTWRALLTSGDRSRVLSCDASAGEIESIVDLVEAAGWDEREAHDLHGLAFPGHSPMPALAAHPDDPAQWMTSVSGDGVHQVAVGPIHAGVIESGHFRFHVIGERILAMDPRLFYKHRGLERAAEGLHVGEALTYAARACAACSVTNTVAYANAIESAHGLQPDRELRTARTVLLELERLYNHLNDVSAICGGVGFAPGAMAFAAFKERAQRLNQRLAGHRFLFHTVALAASTLRIGQADAHAVRRELSTLAEEQRGLWRELRFAGSVQDRLVDVGRLTRQDAVRLGAVGPCARAAGVRQDTRSESPRLFYGDFAPATPEQAGGDVAARVDVRQVELEQTFAILDELLTDDLAPGGVGSLNVPASDLGVARVESPRGETVCTVQTDGHAIGRMHLRTGSYANWPAVAHATRENLLGDFPLINKSFELCYACADR